MEALVELGADPNAAEKWTGFTILHYTALRGDYELAVWLRQLPGIDLDSKNSRGLTAYQLAFEGRDLMLMDLFRAYGAKREDSLLSVSE